jgi:hypothetical protein
MFRHVARTCNGWFWTFKIYIYLKKIVSDNVWVIWVFKDGVPTAEKIFLYKIATCFGTWQEHVMAGSGYLKFLFI